MRRGRWSCGALVGRRLTIHANRQSGVGGGHFEDDDLDAGESVALLGGLGTADSLAGQVVFATPTGRTISADFLSEEEDAFGLDCVIGGTARVAGQGFSGAGSSSAGPTATTIRAIAPSSARSSTRGSSRLTELRHRCRPWRSTRSATRPRSRGVAAHSSSADGFVAGGGAAQGIVAYAPLTDDASGHGVTAAANGAVASVDWLAEEGGDAFGGGPNIFLEATWPEQYARMVARLGLGADEVAEWVRAAEAMYIPYDANLGIHPQDSAFHEREVWDLPNTPADKKPLMLHFHPLVIYRFQVLKLAGVMLALVLQGDQFTAAEKRADFEYYEPIVSGDSSLSGMVQSIIAAEVGYHDLALRYFYDGLFGDLADLRHNTSEGVHVASAGGSLERPGVRVRRDA